MKKSIILKIFVALLFVFIGILDIHAKECTYLGTYSFTIDFNDSTSMAESIKGKNNANVTFYGSIFPKLKKGECPVVYALEFKEEGGLTVSSYADYQISSDWIEFKPADDLDPYVNCKYSTDDGHSFSLQFYEKSHNFKGVVDNDIAVKNTSIGLRYNGTCPTVNYLTSNGEVYLCASPTNCKTATTDGTTNDIRVCNYYENGNFIKISFIGGKIQPNSIQSEKHYNSYTFIGDENRVIGSNENCPTMYFYIGRMIGQDGNFFCYGYEPPADGICKSDVEQSERGWVEAGTQGSYDPNTDTFIEDPGWGNYVGITNEGKLSCEEILGKNGVKLLHDAFLLMKIAAPILFIVLNMIDFMKGIPGNAAAETSNGLRHIVIRSACCALLYLLPYLLNVLFKLVGVISFDACGIV